MAHRIERVNSLIRREISELIQHQIKDPRLGTLVSVTAVNTTSDLKYAKVFVSSICSQEEKQKILNVLTGASGFFRKELTRELKLRHIPELSFHWDDSIERGDRLSRLIDEVNSEQDL